MGQVVRVSLAHRMIWAEQLLQKSVSSTIDAFPFMNFYDTPPNNALPHSALEASAYRMGH